MQIYFTPSFVRAFDKLEPELQDETIEKIEQFKDRDNHKQLRVHKLQGVLSGRWSFSVNYKYRIIFEWCGKQGAILHAIGSHDVYKH